MAAANAQFKRNRGQRFQRACMEGNLQQVGGGGEVRAEGVWGGMGGSLQQVWARGWVATYFKEGNCAYVPLQTFARVSMCLSTYSLYFR